MQSSSLAVRTGALIVMLSLGFGAADALAQVRLSTTTAKDRGQVQAAGHHDHDDDAHDEHGHGKLAGHKHAASGEGDDDEDKDPTLLEEVVVDTSHEVTIDGKTFSYTASAGRLPLRDKDQDDLAYVFYIAYTKDDVADQQRRPILFSFNGGPGSSSVWLHFGIFGPRWVEFPDEALHPVPPFELKNNAASILDRCDLVFIDPVSTGYSRAIKGGDEKQFHGVREDAESVAEFIRLYVARNHRWQSPKFIAGESYGTVRAAALAAELQMRHGMFLHGVILVSAILDFHTMSTRAGNDLPYIVCLPTMTAGAWSHGKLAPELQRLELAEAVKSAEAFALGDYATALMRGDMLKGAEREAFAERLAGFLGLSKKYVLLADLRVSPGRFRAELLRDERMSVGRFDLRFKTHHDDPTGNSIGNDPSYTAIFGPYSAALNHYVRHDLKFEDDRVYEILTNVWPWNMDYGQGVERPLEVASTLKRAMEDNPHLRVLVQNGYHDLATPHFGTHYTLNHLNLPEDLQQRIEMTYYHGGHMMYLYGPARMQMRRDLVRFIDGSLKQRQPR